MTCRHECGCETELLHDLYAMRSLMHDATDIPYATRWDTLAIMLREAIADEEERIECPDDEDEITWDAARPESQAVTRRREYDAPIGSDDQ